MNTQAERREDTIRDLTELVAELSNPTRTGTEMFRLLASAYARMLYEQKTLEEHLDGYVEAMDSHIDETEDRIREFSHRISVLESKLEDDQK